MTDNKLNTNFLGRGWGFPPTFDKKAQTVLMTEAETDIEKSLEILVNTATGERIMQHDYGCDLSEYLFEPMSTTIRTLMKDKIETAILYFEPRIILENVALRLDEINEGLIWIDVTYIVRTTNSRRNLVTPFYKNEATGIPL